MREPACSRSVRLIAFYLPQFHPIPENDEWWGKGFTEWTNVVKARPLFRGHYQPHLPADLGFYDLRVPEVREQQAELAREHGIHGFCYYHYWFHGKRLLERPFNEVLASGKPDFPFCLCWANESWTRAWDGQSRDVLMEQTYSEADDRAHIRWLIPAFADPRYIRVDGKPLFAVYRAGRLPNPQKTAQCWREETRAAGIGDIFLCRVEGFSDERCPPTRLGFDAAIEFAPDWDCRPTPLGRNILCRCLDRLGGTSGSFAAHDIFEYADLVRNMQSKRWPSYVRFPCVTPGFDNSPRRASGAVVFRNSSPELYEQWLRSVVQKQTEEPEGRRLVFVNAWNEWAEGNHLEPCQRWGRNFLQATRAAVTSPARPRSPSDSTSALSHAPHVPTVTVLMPTHGHAAYVLDALASVFNQTYADYEIVVVNDGSPDNTRDLLRPLADSGRIRYIEQPHAGHAAACNRGIREARGQFISILDDDDLWPPDKLEWQVQELLAEPGVALVYGYMTTFGDPPYYSHPSFYGASGWARRELLCAGWLRSPGQAMIRTEALRCIGGFAEDIWGNDDWDLYLRLAKKQPFRYVPRLALRYRVHASNASRRIWPMYINACKVHRRNVGLLPMPWNWKDWFACRGFIRRVYAAESRKAMTEALGQKRIGHAARMWLLGAWLGAVGVRDARDVLRQARAAIYRRYPVIHRAVRMATLPLR